MKKISKALSFLLFFILLFGTIVLPVSADIKDSFTGTVGEGNYFIIYSDAQDVITEARISSGTVPGMSLDVAGNVTLGLVGTPTAAGEFVLQISLTTQNTGTKNLSITVKIKPIAGTSSGIPAITKNPTGETIVEGGSAVFVARANNTKQYVWEIAIGDAVVDCADLPSYLGGSIIVSGTNTEALTLSNIPLALNNAYVRCRFVGTEDSVYSEYAKITVTAAQDAVPVVTKHPTSETCEEGGEVVFLARANYAQSFVWQLVAPDGTTYDCANASKTFKGLRVFDADKELIVLENVPLTLDGYQILCKFTGNGEVSSKAATIHVTAKPTETAPTEPPTEPSTEPLTEAPTELPTEPLTEPPTEPLPETTPTEAPTEPFEETKPAAKPETDPEPTPSTGNDGDNGRTITLIIVAIIAVAAIAVAVIAAFVILKLKKTSRRGR